MPGRSARLAYRRAGPDDMPQLPADLHQLPGHPAGRAVEPGHGYHHGRPGDRPAGYRNTGPVPRHRPRTAPPGQRLPVSTGPGLMIKEHATRAAAAAQAWPAAAGGCHRIPSRGAGPACPRSPCARVAWRRAGPGGTRIHRRDAAPLGPDRTLRRHHDRRVRDADQRTPACAAGKRRCPAGRRSGWASVPASARASLPASPPRGHGCCARSPTPAGRFRCPGHPPLSPRPAADCKSSGPLPMSGDTPHPITRGRSCGPCSPAADALPRCGGLRTRDEPDGAVEVYVPAGAFDVGEPPSHRIGGRRCRQ